MWIEKLCVAIFLLFFAASTPALGQSPDSSKLASSTGAVLSEDQIRDLIRRAAERDLQNDKQQRNYTYVERQEEHTLDGDGHVKSTESKTHEVMDLYGEQVERLIAKDDKPLSTKDAAKEEERIQKLVEKRKNESDEERK